MAPQATHDEVPLVMQVVPVEQAVPHAPQFALLVSGTHAPEQLVSPVVQHSELPAPPLEARQLVPAPQVDDGPQHTRLAVPQATQLAVEPLAMQVFPVEHAAPQALQLVFEFSWVSQPLERLESQSP